MVSPLLLYTDLLSLAASLEVTTAYRLDLVAGNSNTPDRLYLNNGDGAFGVGSDISTDSHWTYDVVLVRCSERCNTEAAARLKHTVGAAQMKFFSIIHLEE